MAEANLAVVIAVSKYDRPGCDLPACIMDGNLMEAVLAASGRFLPGNTLVISGTDATSANVKAKLSEFVEGRKGKDNGDVLFYFSGHGSFDGRDFFFLLSDYDPDRLNQTSLSNSELDGMLRSLKPKLAVKVVDACQSGVHYIKEPEVFSKALNQTKENFNECYFMFSSRHDQSSYQDNQLSHFTREFAFALKKPEGQSVRYKDIADSISDAFDKRHKDQQPVFVVQGAFTHQFCKVTPELLAALTAHLPISADSVVAVTTGLAIGGGTAEATSSPIRQPTFDELILAKVHAEAPKYGSKEDGDKTALAVKAVIESAVPEGVLENLYAFSVDVPSHTSELPNEGSIATFFKDKDDYFVTLDYTGGDDGGNPYLGITAGMFSRNPRRLSGYTNTIRMPLEVATITAKPKHENLPWWRCHFAFAYSKKEFRYFYSFCQLKDINWDRQDVPDNVKWYTDGVPLKDYATAVAKIKSVMEQFQRTIIKKLAERLAVPVSEPVSET